MLVSEAFMVASRSVLTGRADQSQAIKELEKLLRTLASVGLQTEVRQGDETSLLIFVRATSKRLKRAVYRSR